jgi:hypothetical protein
MSSVQNLIAAANPRTTEPNPSEIDAALQRVLTRRTEPASADPPASRHSRPRHVVPATAFAAAAAVAAAVVLTGVAHTRAGSGASTGHPGANAGRLSTAAMIRRVANVMNGSGTGILYVVENDSAGVVGGPQMTNSDESWTQLDGQHASWDQMTWETGSPVNGSTNETVVAGHWTEQYSAQTNTITKVYSTGQAPGGPASWLIFAVTGEMAGAPDAKLPEADPGQPRNFGAQVTALLHNPKVTVDWHARFDGQPAISLYSAAAQNTLYVEPGTYRPLGVVMISPADGHNGPTGRRYQQVIAITTWQTLPDGSVPIPNLAQLHPTARIQVATSLKKG